MNRKQIKEQKKYFYKFLNHKIGLLGENPKSPLKKIGILEKIMFALEILARGFK